MISDAISGWAGWALAYPKFGVLVNPIPTRGADYAHHIAACPPGFDLWTDGCGISRSGTPVDLYLNCEKSSWQNQIRQTGFLACKINFEMDFCRLHWQ